MNKNRPKPNNARPAAPPTTPPTIAPTGVFPEELLSGEGVGVVPVAEVADEVVVARAVVVVMVVVCDAVGVEAMGEFVDLIEEETWRQKSLVPPPPFIHLLSQNLMTTMSPLSPPRQWKSVSDETPLSLASKDAFLSASLI